MIGFLVFKAINDLKITVEVGLVVGTIPQTTPTGSAHKRKNWLFCDSPDRVNVYHYLTYLLEKRPNDRMSDKEFEQLAPWNEEVKAEIKRRAANLKK